MQQYKAILKVILHRKRRKIEILQEDGAKIKDGKFVH